MHSMIQVQRLKVILLLSSLAFLTFLLLAAFQENFTAEWRGHQAAYAARLVELGIAPKLKVLIAIAPMPSVRSARWMKEKLFGTIIPESLIERMEKAADARAEGKRIVVGGENPWLKANADLGQKAGESEVHGVSSKMAQTADSASAPFMKARQWFGHTSRTASRYAWPACGFWTFRINTPAPTRPRCWARASAWRGTRP